MPIPAYLARKRKRIVKPLLRLSTNYPIAKSNSRKSSSSLGLRATVAAGGFCRSLLGGRASPRLGFCRWFLIAKAAPQSIHQADDVLGRWRHWFSLRGKLCLLFPEDLDHRGSVVILQECRVKVVGLGVDDVLGKFERFRRQGHCWNRVRATSSCPSFLVRLLCTQLLRRPSGCHSGR